MPSRQLMVRVVALVVNVGVILATINVFAYSNEPIVLFDRCVYRMIYEREGPAGVLVLGTSRVGRGIDSFIIEENLTDQVELDNSIVVTMYRTNWGLGDQVQRFEAVDDELGLDDILLVEYSEERTNRYQSYGDVYALRTTTDELVRHWDSSNEPVDGKIRDLLGAFTTKLDQALIDTVRDRRHSANPREGSPTVTEQNRDCERRNQEEIRLRQNQLDSLEEELTEQYGDWRNRPDARWEFDRIDYERYDYFVHELVAEAERRDVRIVFFRMPDYLERPLDAEWVADFEARYGAPILGPPMEVLEELYDGGMNNVGHTGEKGREIYSAWLGQALGEYLAGES